jgi:hypothetical protein
MSRLKIEMYRYHELLFGRVLEQDEDLKGKGEIISKDGYRLMSRDLPKLCGLNFCLRGNETHADNNIFFHDYVSESKAIEASQAFREMVHEINAEDQKPMYEAIERIM